MNTCGKHNMAKRNPMKHEVRRRGSVLLLVVAVLMLIFILGLMFMEIARLDRASTTNFSAAQDLEMVYNVAVSKIESQLKRDLEITDPNGTPSDDTDDVFFSNGESYDYPGPLDSWLAPPDPHSTSAGQVSSITDVQVAGVPNADADGDGLNDSIWQNAPIPLFNGLAYRVAVRTIDLSGLVNLNVALSQVSLGGAYDTNPDAAATNASRWLTPCDIDAGGMMYRFIGYEASLPAATPTGMDQLYTLLTTRMTADYGMPTQAAARESYWANVVSLSYPSGFYKADTSDLFAISYRNGLHSDKLSSTLLKDHLYNIFRYAATAAATPEVGESIYTDIPGVSTEATYYQLNAKPYFTAQSGANLFAPAFAGETGLTGSYSPVVKRDLNNALTADTTGQFLRAQINKVLTQGTFTPPASMTIDQYTAQFVAALTDYADADSELAKVNDGAVDRYGFEALPIISEVYAQRPYLITVATDVGGGTSWDVTWTAQGNAGYAIELRNPFRTPVDLTTVELVVDGVSWGKLSDADLANRPSLGVDEVVTIYRNSTGGTAGEDNVQTKIAGGVINADPTDAWSVTPGPITVELRATEQGGAALTWAYWKVTTAEGLPDTINQNPYAYPSDPKVAGVTGYKQTVAIGGDQTLDMLTVLPGSYSGSTTPYPVAYTDMDNLGETPKTTQVVGSLANPAAEQLIFQNAADGKLTHVGDLALIAAIPLDGTKSISEAWNAATSADDFRLNPTSTQLVGAGDLAVPHAVLLMDRFSTISMFEDSVDNNGDGQGVANDDYNDEFFLPGTLNLNTAPKDVLLYALPVPDPAVKTQMVDSIIAYRDATERPAIASLRTNKGLAYLGELMNLDQMPTKSVVINTNAAADNRLGPGVGVVIDFLSNPNDTTGDGIANDREEKATIARWLSQTCSTRSDVFLTYLRIRGVNPTDGTVVNEKRVMILFDRSKVLGFNGKVSATPLSN